MIKIVQLINWLRGQKTYCIATHPGMPRPYVEAVHFGLIDKRIATLVAKMNTGGIFSTMACCEGHLNKLSCGEADIPYVWFDADIEIVNMLNQSLINAAPNRGGMLHYHWIAGYESRGYDLRPHFPVNAHRTISRSKLDEDFLTIGKIVDSIVKSNALNLKNPS